MSEHLCYNCGAHVDPSPGPTGTAGEPSDHGYAIAFLLDCARIRSLNLEHDDAVRLRQAAAALGAAPADGCEHCAVTCPECVGDGPSLERAYRFGWQDGHDSHEKPFDGDWWERAKAEVLATWDSPASPARKFPLNPRGTGSIPWPVAERAYLAYSKKHGTNQSLERLAERGGFYVEEMDEFLPGWRDLAFPIQVSPPAREADELWRWLDEQVTLHNGVEFLYVVDGYEAMLVYGDRNTLGPSAHGATLREAVAKLRALAAEGEPAGPTE